MSNELSTSGKHWAIILAGDEGERVRPLVQRWLGRHVPKQYCTFVGTRSMFQHTLSRARMLTDQKLILTVIAPGHRQEALAQCEERASGRVLVQPSNRDAAAGDLSTARLDPITGSRCDGRHIPVRSLYLSRRAVRDCGPACAQSR